MSPCSGGDRIATAIRDGARGGSPAIVAYLTAGWPTPERFARLVPEIAAEADVVEIGVPFSDPMADGATIQRTSRVALENGVDLRSILAALASVAPRADVPFVLMSYVNPLLAYGLEALASDAAAAGVAGLIVPDLPIEESAACDSAFAMHGIAMIRLATPATPEERLFRLARASQGFLYAVTVNGVTGGSAEPPIDRLRQHLARVRAATDLPICAGFGMRSAEQVRALAGAADGVIVGSALLEAIEAGADGASFLRALRAPLDASQGGRP